MNKDIEIRRKKRKYLYFGVIIVCLVCLVAIELFGKELFDDAALNTMVNLSATRALGSVVFILLCLHLGYNVMSPFRRPFLRSLVFVLPCLLIAINNFPIISTLTGDAYLVKPAWYIPVLAFECLAVGIFEEFAFRGFVFLTILEKRRRSVFDVFVSILLTSAIFGLIHLVNLLGGAGLGSVIMQIGYSFLIGGMCSVVLIRTKNIWLCVIIHAVYNFAGDFMPSLGAGTWWDTPTVILTVILAVAVTVYIVYALIKTDLRGLEEIFVNKNIEKKEI